MSLTKEEILNTVENMSVSDIVDLVSMMEKKFGVSAAATIHSKPIEVVEEKTTFNVLLSSIGSNKVSVIKVVRSITGLGLKEAKDLTESAPIVIKENVSKNDAEMFKKSLEDSGASVDIK